MAEKELGNVPRRGIAGYSLAELFALYAIYRTELFSGWIRPAPLWFPGMKAYIFSHEPKRRPDCIYFSLGDKESKTKNPILRTVQENTEEICAYYQRRGIDTVFRLNPGNHFVQSVRRTAAGIVWMLGPVSLVAEPDVYRYTGSREGIVREVPRCGDKHIPCNTREKRPMNTPTLETERLILRKFYRAGHGRAVPDSSG